MKVLYLFSGSRDGLLEKIKKGEAHGNGFWGMLELPRFGIEADYIEVEQTYPKSIARFIRRHLNNYAIHLPLLWRFFSYDIVFTSSSFASQLFFASFSPKKPLWIMHDFSIKGLLGQEKTLRQKLFRFMVMRAAGVVTLSLDETEFLEKRFPHLRGRVEFIPFGIDLEFFKPQGEKEVRQVLAVGFDPDRDWKTLVEAVRDIDVPVVLATRESRVAKLRPFPESIKVMQFSPRDLVREYDRSAVIVVPLDTSHGVNDAMGCSTLFEAMVMGKAIVATRTKAMESYVTHGENALLVKEGDVSQMRSAIEAVLGDPVLRKNLGEKARRYALANLDIHACTEKLAVFFRKVFEAERSR
jgi:glycosyltransferase involved in cell wall biosynthesis